jgi:Peptidase family M28
MKLVLLLLGSMELVAQSTNFTARYNDAAERLIRAALPDQEGYRRLTYLCDRIGNRLSGSAALDTAVSWSADQMKAVGLENVRKIPVKVPHWVRGEESGQIVSPIARPLHMLGIGMSVATPAGGVTADAVVVSNFDELGAVADRVKGKIVVYNAPYESYGKTVVYRSAGPSRAAKLGAVAVLVRSITPLAMQVPHTGALIYDPSAPKIPAAAISIEDALLLDRFQRSGGTARVHLSMQAHLEPEADSADVIGEIPGSKNPEEVVVLGGHLDSWDVGQGAQDDGSGIMASLEAVALIKKSGLHARRTIRLAFWVNEENGSRGAAAYRAWVGDKIRSQVAAIEMDGGAERPTGFGYSTFHYVRGTSMGSPRMSVEQQQSFALCEQIAGLLKPIDATHVRPYGGGEDIEPLTREGVPSFSPNNVGAHYFDWHHTATDTLDKVDPEDFNRNIAVLAVLSYVLADMPEKLVGLSAESTE